MVFILVVDLASLLLCRGLSTQQCNRTRFIWSTSQVFRQFDDTFLAANFPQ